jgi:glycosyltransferase involved in cell wall biosynthesis
MLLRGPLDNDSRVNKEIESLGKFGHEVTILSINGSHHGTADSRVLSYNAKKRILPGVSSILLFFKFLSFAASCYKDHVVIHAHDLNTLPVAVLVRWLNFNRTVSIVYDTHEYAQNDVPNESRFNQYCKFVYEKFFIKFSDHVITVSDAIANEYTVQYGISKPDVILNCPPMSSPGRASNYFRQRFDINLDQRVFLYQGALCPGRGIDSLLDAFNSFEESGPVIIFMGYGEMRSEIEFYQSSSNNIFYHEAVSPKLLPEFTSAADVGIAFIEDCCLSYRYCLPNKLFEYLMARLPVLVSNLPEMKKMVLDYGVGFVAETGSAEDLSVAINRADEAFTEFPIKRLEYASSVFNWEAESLKLKDIFSRIESYHFLIE